VVFRAKLQWHLWARCMWVAYPVKLQWQLWARTMSVAYPVKLQLDVSPHGPRRRLGYQSRHELGTTHARSSASLPVPPSAATFCPTYATGSCRAAPSR